MHTSVAPSSDASRARRTTSATGRRYPSSSRWSRLNAQKPQCLMQTLVKLMLRLTTNVTTSPTCRRRSSSAANARAWRARARARRTSCDAQSRAGESLPASPVLIRVLHQPAVVHERGEPRTQGLVDELRTPHVLGIDRETLAEDEPRVLGRSPELR